MTRPSRGAFESRSLRHDVQRQNGVVKHENMDKKGGKISPKEADIKSSQWTLLAVMSDGQDPPLVRE